MKIMKANDDTSGITKFVYLIERIDRANTRAALLNWFTACSRPLIKDIDEKDLGSQILILDLNKDEKKFFDKVLAVHVPKDPKKYKDIQQLIEVDPSHDCYVYGVIVPNEANPNYLLVKLNEDAYEVPFRMYERFQLEEGMIQNYHGEPTVTDVGKFFLNELILVMPFGDLIPYLNARFDPGKLDKQVADLIVDGKINRDMLRRYMDNGYWYGEDGSISTACWSEKSLVTDPNIPKRKKELLEQYKNNLDDPVVLSKIEKELISMDKNWIKGDSSEPFFAVAGGKAWNEQRKKMYVMFGLNTAFDKTSGKFSFVADSLSDGWTAETLPVAANDIRRGSYGRGVETAKGGTQTKFTLRIFQEVSVDEEDCGSKKGIKIVLNEKNIKDYYGRYLVDGTLIEEKNKDQLLGKEVEIRSPMYCLTKPGYCYKCVGEQMRKLGIKRIGMQALSITSSFTSLAMKSIHAGGVSSTEIKDFKRYLR